MQFKEKTQISISYKKKKKRLSATKQFGNTKKKKRSKEKESFNDLNWDLIEQKRGMD
jgi:hypothetical protein